MIASTMVTWLERRTDGAWTSEQYVEFLNQGLLTVGQLVSSVDPDFFVRIRRQPIEAGVRYYPRPVDGKHIIEVSLKNTTSGGYAPIEKRTKVFIRNRYLDRGVSAGGTTVWARFGRYVQIDPTPSASVVDGLQIVEAYLPTIPTDATGLGTEPPIPIDLHQAVVNRAHRLLLPETPDFAGLAKVLDEEYGAMVGQWAQGYFETAEPTQLDVDDPGYVAED